MKNRIIVVVNGGVVQDIFTTSKKVMIALVDWDNIEGDPTEAEFSYEAPGPVSKKEFKEIEENIKRDIKILAKKYLADRKAAGG